MIVTSLKQELIPLVIDLMDLGAPYIKARTYSDYWLYASLFSSTCPVAMEAGDVAGVVIAFRSQDVADDVYIQDVMIHPGYRRRGAARVLLESVRKQAASWGCARLYLTSEPDNSAAHTTWKSLGFVNVAGDQTINGVSVITDFKGPGKTRAVYQLDLR